MKKTKSPLFINGNHKDGQSNYRLVFGSDEWAIICSLIHSSVIRCGINAQSQIDSLIPKDLIIDFDTFWETSPQTGKHIIINYQMPTSNGNDKAITPDYLILAHSKLHKNRICYVVEVKLGTNFDTGKSPAAREDLEKVAKHIMDRTGYNTRIRICSLTARNRKEVMQGFKGRFTKDEVLLGDEFCQMAHIQLTDVLGAIFEIQNMNIQDLETLVKLKLDGADKNTIIDKVNELRSLRRGQRRLF